MSAPAVPSPASANSAPPAAQFQRKLGLFDATMLVAGTMIGSGIFIVSADIARDVGSAGWLLAIWLLTGVMTVAGALCYGELGGMMPHAGGQYVFLREAYSPLWGFLYGWALFLVIQTGTMAAVGVGFAKFLGVLIPGLGTDHVIYQVQDFNVALSFPLPWMSEPLVFFERHGFSISAGQVVASGVVAVLAVINCFGVEAGKWVQNVFTLAKTLGLLLLIVAGLTLAANADAIHANWDNLWDGIRHSERFLNTARVVPAGGFTVALMVAGGATVGALFSADAWNNVTFIAAELKDPRRILPRCLALGTGLVICLYILANLAYLAALPVQGTADGATPFLQGIAHARDDRVGTAVLELVSPGVGVPLMAIAIVVSTFGCVNGLSLMGARLYWAMARDSLFFASVGRLNRRGVPAAGLILQALWSILLIYSGTYSDLLDYVIFACLLFYALTVVGLFVLRRKQPHAERPYRVWGYPWLPALYVSLCTLIMLDLLIVRPVYTWPGLVIVLSGIPVYFLWRRFGRDFPLPRQGERVG